VALLPTEVMKKIPKHYYTLPYRKLHAKMERTWKEVESKIQQIHVLKLKYKRQS